MTAREHFSNGSVIDLTTTTGFSTLTWTTNNYDTTAGSANYVAQIGLTGILQGNHVGTAYVTAEIVYNDGTVSADVIGSTYVSVVDQSSAEHRGDRA